MAVLTTRMAAATWRFRSRPRSGSGRGAARFFAGFGSALFGLLAVLAIFNVIVDPYDAFRLWQHARINAQKTELMTRGGRVAKSLHLQKDTFDTVLVGSSRVLLGIDPQSRFLRGQRTYNAGLGGTNMYELHDVLDLIADDQHQLKRVIIDLDFLLFSPFRTVRGDYVVSGFADRNPLQLYAYALFAFGTTLDSVATLRANLTGTAPGQRRDGYEDVPPDGHAQPGTRAALAHSIEAMVGDGETYAGLAAEGDYDQSRMALLRAGLERLTGQGVEVILFISPMHALLLEAQAAMGIDDAYEEWKRELTALVAELRLANPEAKLGLWDFGTYNSITTEPVPGPGEARAMRWYWEASHYRSSVGDLILARLLDQAAKAPGLAPDFGRRLTPETLDEELAGNRLAQADYRRTHAADIQSLVHATTERLRSAVTDFVPPTDLEDPEPD